MFLRFYYNKTLQGKTMNKTLDYGTRSIGLDKYRLWPGYKTNGGWIVKVPYVNNLGKIQDSFMYI